MPKKSQIYGIVIKYILMAVIFGIIILFGFNMLNKLHSQTNNMAAISFENALKIYANELYSDPGSASQRILTAPGGVSKLYFIDLNEEIDEDIKKDVPVIYEIVNSTAKKNAFLMRADIMEKSFYIEHLKLKYPYYRCYEVNKNGQFGFYFENYKGGTSLDHLNHQFNCGYIPVLMEDDGLNDDIKDRTEDGTTVDFPTGYQDRIKDTKENVFVGRKVDIKKDGTNIKIRIKPFGGKNASDFIYVEDIPKECFEDLKDYLVGKAGLPFYRPLIYDSFMSVPNREFDWIEDPLIVWHFGEDEQITDKQEIEYELTESIDCMKLINALGFGKIS